MTNAEIEQAKFKYCALYSAAIGKKVYFHLDTNLENITEKVKNLSKEEIRELKQEYWKGWLVHYGSLGEKLYDIYNYLNRI